MTKEEKYLIAKSDIYSYLSSYPSYWVRRGYLKKVSIDKNQYSYVLTQKAVDELLGVFLKKLELRLYISSIKEKMALSKNCNLLSLMEA